MVQQALCGRGSAILAARSPLPAAARHFQRRARQRAAHQQRPAGARPCRRRLAVVAATDNEQRTAAERRQREVATQATNSSLDEGDSSDSPAGGIDFRVVGALAAVAGIGLIAGGGYVYRDTIKQGLTWFISVVDDWGSWGYVAYTFVYTALELVIIPAVPLTMASGVLFGVIPGTIVVSLASTAAAAIAFLISRYAARDKIADLAKDNKKFTAIDKAIGKDSFKVVLLLRLSPLLPLSLSNYLYGLTSVDFVPYVLGSWLGQLPGTIAYVSAGSYGRKVMNGADAGGGISSWQLAVGAGVTILAIGYIGRLAKQALDEVDDDLDTT